MRKRAPGLARRAAAPSSDGDKGKVERTRPATKCPSIASMPKTNCSLGSSQPTQTSMRRRGPGFRMPGVRSGGATIVEVSRAAYPS